MSSTVSVSGHVPIEDALERLANVRSHLNSVLRGKDDKIERVLACLLARGHLLLDDLPGTGKTTLAKALAICIGGRFARMQCTPDLLPTDVTGFHLFNQKNQEFQFHPGPVFSDVLLADEINRTTPRTQSALLEAMAERQVTIDSKLHPLSAAFFVIATQNPIDSHGAYPLPEAQLDRFTMKLELGYPDRKAQLEMLAMQSGIEKDSNGESSESNVLSLDQLHTLQRHAASITVHPTVQSYLVDLTEATRDWEAVELGVSPRGMLAWQRAAQSWAMLKHRDFVTPSDIQEIAPDVLSVRLITRNAHPMELIGDLLRTVPIPEYR